MLRVANMLAFCLFFFGMAQCAAQFCGSGAFWSTTQSKCVACPIATFCAGNCVNSCGVCPPNTVPNAERTTCLSGTCVVCPVGSYCGGGISVVACPAGTYASASGLIAVEGCASCLAGSYTSGAGMTVCLRCAAGSYAFVPQATVCSLCAPGNYQTAAGALSCRACDQGTYSSASGMALPCALCTAGTYGATDACVPCPGGTFATGLGTLENNCTLCASGTFSAATGAIAACQPCDKGFYQPEAGSLLCFACPPNTFLNRTGASLASSCVYCDDNRQTIGSNATSSDQCVCRMGFAGPLCAACPGGSYAEETGRSKCTLCPAGTYDPSTSVVHDSSIRCVEAPANGVSPEGATDFACLAGYKKADNGLLMCEQCPPGSFSQQGDAGCTACVFGTTTTVATAQANCSCFPGYFKNKTVCELCPANFYCYGNFLAAIACALGKSGPAGASDPSQSCVCQAGWYGAPGVLACSSCGGGFYCPTGSQFPIACPQNTESAGSSTRLADCVCRAGFKVVGGVCVMCSVDEFCLSGNMSMCRNHSVAAVGGATSQANCTCSPGFWSVDAIAACQVCPPGFYCEGGMRISQCPVNADTLGANQRTSLLECACKAGYYSTPACTACPAGSYCSNSLRIGCAPFASSNALSSSVQACGCDAVSFTLLFFETCFLRRFFVFLRATLAPSAAARHAGQAPTPQRPIAVSA